MNAGFEFRRVEEVNGKPWTLCFKVHVVQENDAENGEGLRFKSSVSLWPPSLSKAEERRLKESGWYSANAAVFRHARSR